MALSFREQVRRDFETVFLNDKEFGCVCDWNGAPLHLVRAATNSLESESAIGLSHRVRQIVCMAASFPKRPTPGQSAMVDGEEWMVFDVQPLLEHLVITLTQEASV